MPKALHDKLLKEGVKRGLKGKSLDSYVYGTLKTVKPEGKKKTRLVKK